jgi:hypothetical protein
MIDSGTNIKQFLSGNKFIFSDKKHPPENSSLGKHKNTVDRSPETIVKSIIQQYRKLFSRRKKKAKNILETSKKFKGTNKNTGKINIHSSLWFCGSVRRSKDIDVQLVKDIATNRPFHNNLLRCGSVSVCPECSSKISRQRLNEAKEALEHYRSEGYNILFMTLTAPHYNHDRLTTLIDYYSEAWRWIRQQKNVRKLHESRPKQVGNDDYINNLKHNHLKAKFWKKAKQLELTEQEPEFETKGIRYLRSWDYTFGRNGHHLHQHIVIITKHDQTTIENAFKPLWHRCIQDRLKRTGNNYAFDLQAWDEKTESLSKYLFKKDEKTSVADVSKWTLQQEIINGKQKHSKKFGNETFTAWELLDLANGEMPYPAWAKGSKFDPERVFKEYAEAFKGRRQFAVSQDFFRDAGVLEKTDDEILNQQRNVELITAYNTDLWHQISKYDLQVDILNQWEDSGVNGVYEMIRMFFHDQEIRVRGRLYHGMIEFQQNNDYNKISLLLIDPETGEIVNNNENKAPP